MNINENIYRIKTLMGVLSESRELEEMARPAKYSLEELEAIAKKYSNATEWKKSKDEYDRKAYGIAWAIKYKGRPAEGLTKEDGKDWYKRITAHFVNLLTKYTLGELEAIAKKYDNLSEWMNSKDEYDRKACGMARNIKVVGRPSEGITKEDAKDWYNRITAHFVSKYNNYSLEEIEAIAKKYNNLSEWMNSEDEYDRKAYRVAVGIRRQGRQAEGLTKEDGKDWYERITAHFKRKKHERRKVANYLYSLEEIEAVAKKYDNHSEWMNSKDEYDRKVFRTAVKVTYKGRPGEGLAKEDGKDWYKRITAHFKRKKHEYQRKHI